MILKLKNLQMVNEIKTFEEKRTFSNSQLVILVAHFASKKCKQKQKT